MAMVRFLVLAITGGLLLAAPIDAQDLTGTISGRVVDSTTQQPLAGATVRVEGTQRGTITADNGGFTIGGVPAGTHQVRATRIGYAPLVQTVTVAAGATASVDFSLPPRAAVLSEVVTTGYGTQRREAISGSVSTVDAEAANKGVIANVNQMLAGRVAGVTTVTSNGEPGGGVQIRIRGGTSISASNDPLYVVDGVPLQNDEISPDAPGIASINPQLSRNPLNSINPGDIESITILKDASATAIYGSRGANGVILITTKRAPGGVGQLIYETYVGAATAAKRLDLASGPQYRQFVQQQVTAGDLPATALTNLGNADTDWEDAILRRGVATNHNLSFAGGSPTTQYRASLNFFKQDGIVISNGLERYQGRLNALHDALGGRLRLGLNLMAARVNNDFAPIENTGGFLGGLFTNMVIYNPTYPIRRASGQYYETWCPPSATECNATPTAQDLKNPVAFAELYEDESPENRLLGNFSGTITLLDNLTAQTTVGVDYTDATRRTFAPRSSPAGAQYNGYARQADRSLQNVNFQQLVTYSPRFGDHSLEVVGGYEFTKTDNRGFDAQMQGFITDVFGVNNLGAGTQASSPVPTSYRVESELASFFSRANYGFADRYFLTGVVRYDGSSRLAEGHQWQLFPGVSASWRVSEEAFMQDAPLSLSTLAVRLGWGKQGNQAVAPYQTKLLLRADPGAVYPIGNVLTTGLRAAQVGNPDLKWETAEQINVGIDYGFMNDRFTGVIDLYQKTTEDLLLEVDVPQPAVVNTRLENIGSIRNRGIEVTFNTPILSGDELNLGLELVASAERNEVTSLGGRAFINTGWVSGQGQSNQYSQRIMVGEPIGTFFAPEFLRVENGQQIFRCRTASESCVDGETIDPADADRIVAGSANPDFSLGLSNNLTYGKFEASWLWRGEFGGKVFNNTALVYRTKSNAKQGRNFLESTLGDPDDISEPAKFSTRWIEDRTFMRLQNLTIAYNFVLPSRFGGGRGTRVYLSGDNLLLIADYSGYDPEVFVETGLASRGIDYLTYPRARTITAGVRHQF
ncbi:MAG TPA: SusC/RagA family TonB-linked outer membrane protein [Gemmatimonadaceae bacterium]|nr:SusC/RagA family TonB-linked outer membrane protein [Gemmatimonadaceae bacterium]